MEILVGNVISKDLRFRIMTSWLEGFAKLHSFKMRGSEFLYSGAMLQSPNYVASVEAGSGRLFSFSHGISHLLSKGV